MKRVIYVAGRVSMALALCVLLITSTLTSKPASAAEPIIGVTTKLTDLYQFKNKKLTPVAKASKNMTFIHLRKSGGYEQVQRSGKKYYIKSSDFKLRTSVKPTNPVTPPAPKRPAHVFVQVTKSAPVYTWKNGKLTENGVVSKNKTFRPYRISGRYFEVVSGASRVYIESSNTKVVLRNITKEDLQDKQLAPFISYHFSTQRQKHVPYFDRSNNTSNTVARAEETIGGLWTVPAPPGKLTVKDVSTFNWVNQIPFSSSNSFPFQIHGFYMLDTLTNAYTHNPDDRYLAYGREMIKSWDPKFPIERYKSVYKWAYNDHGAALRMIAFVNYWNEYRFSKENNDPEFHSQLLRMMYEHGNLLAEQSFYRSKNNHGIFQDMALLMIAETFPEMDRSAEWKRIANERFAAQIDHGISPTGLHLEHSPSYQLYLYQTLIGMIDWTEANGYALDEESKRRVREMPKFMAYMLKPNLKFVQFGDTYAEVMKSSSFPYIQNYPELLYSVTGGTQGQRPTERIIRQDDQYVFFRQHWGEEAPFNQAVNFAMTAGFHGMPHKHFDDLSIDLYGFGDDYIVETGRYGYARAFERYGVFKGEAHNSIHIEGEDFPVTVDKVGKSGITEAKQLPNGQFYTSGQHQLMTGTTHKRSVWYDTLQTFLVQDQLTSNKQNAFLQRFHLAPGFSIVEQTTDQVVATHTDGRTLHMIQLPTSTQGTLTVGDSHVSYADYTWFERKQLITRKVIKSGEYVTLLHLGKTPDDRVQSVNWVEGSEGRVIQYTLANGHTAEIQVN